MDDFDRRTGHAVENLVAIAPHHMHADVRIIGALIRQRMFGDQVDAGIDGVQDAARAGRAVLFEKPMNSVDVGERLRAVSQPYAKPRRFQNASTSSSAASGPRRAAAMAARSSSLRR